MICEVLNAKSCQVELLSIGHEGLLGSWAWVLLIDILLLFAHQVQDEVAHPCHVLNINGASIMLAVVLILSWNILAKPTGILRGGMWIDSSWPIQPVH